MADTIHLVQGSDTFNLDDGADFETKRIELATPQPDVLMHMPDYGENKPVRKEDKDRHAILQLRVVGADWDDVLNNISKIRRWLDEAARAEIDGDTDTVHLQLKRGTAGSTSTNATNHRIKYGWLEGDSDLFSGVGEKLEQVNNLILNLVLAPYGELSAAISLENDMFHDPAFLDESSTAGLAAGWDEFGAATTSTLVTSIALIGGQSQAITMDATAENQGIVSDAVTAAAAAALVAYIWINANTGTDRINIKLVQTDGTVIDSKYFVESAPANYDKTATTNNGDRTWYRYVLSDDGTGPRAGVGAKLRVSRDVGDTSAGGVIRVDGAYIEVGGTNGTTAPDGWMSSRNIDNRADYQTTSQATENYINHIDTWGIPGDEPAKVRHAYQNKEAGGGWFPDIFYMSTCSDGTHLSENQVHWIESDDFSVRGATFGTQVDAATTNGSYEQHTSGGIWDYIEWEFTGDAARALLATPRAVLVGCRSDQAAATIQMKTFFWTTAKTVTSDAITVPGVGADWRLLDLGRINRIGNMHEDLDGVARPDFSIHLRLEGMGAADTFDIDFICLPFVTDKGYFIVDAGFAGMVDEYSLYLYSGTNKVVSTYGALVNYGLGKVPELVPGQITNRVMFISSLSGDKKYAPEHEAAITLEVTPRTRHLLGTI